MFCPESLILKKQLTVNVSPFKIKTQNIEMILYNN